MEQNEARAKVPKYLVTRDLSVLVRRWAEGQGFHVPGREFFEELHRDLDAELRRIFEPLGIAVTFMSWAEIKGNLLSLIEREANGYPVISLDRAYVETADIRFSTNRLVSWSSHNRSWSDLGHGPRPGAGMITTQLERIASSSALARLKDKKVVVVDDGVWTGKTFYALQELLRGRGIEIQKFLVALHIKQQTPSDLLKKLRAPIIPPDDERFKFEPGEVMEWVCKRDFFLGVPYSGRTLGIRDLGLPNGSDDPAAIRTYYPRQPLPGNQGAPYLLPLGNPIGWASIPAEEAKAFSQVCLGLARRLYEGIEEETSRVLGYPRPVFVKDLARPPFFYRRPDVRVIAEIDKSLEILETLKL